MKRSHHFEAHSSPDPRRDREAILYAYTEALQNGDLHAQDELREWAGQQPDVDLLIPLLDNLEEAWGASLAEDDVESVSGDDPNSSP